MDRCDLEPCGRLYSAVAGMHQLLRDADGCAPRRHGHSKVSRVDAKERTPLRVDWQDQARQSRTSDTDQMAQAKTRIRQLNVRSLPRGSAGKVCRIGMVGD